ncbi:zinc knuckle domain protein [Moniliophthora roreri]|nr:zinc knuckle domain protein [Moniliophthora roreri]
MAYQFSRKGCFKCGNLGHIAENSECPSLRIQQGSNQKCYNCGRFGHIARACTSGAGGAFASRAPPPGRALNTSTLPPVKCYRCGGPNHMARDCLAAPGTSVTDNTPTGPSAANKNKTCYKCQQEGHIARECPENSEFVG